MRNLLIYRYVDAVARTGSIRKAADQLAITPSALNRRILALEQELDVPIFERLGRGVRLSTAGEILIHMFRQQLADVDRVKSQLADLSGLRRGHVSMACSQALLPYFLPEEIHNYQDAHPDVTFGIQIRDGDQAEEALLNYSADLALVFEPLSLADFQTILRVPQPIHAVMSKWHPLAKEKTAKLSQCLEYPLALPSQPYAVRNVLEVAAARMSVKLTPAVEAESYIFLRNFARMKNAITFEIKIGVPQNLVDTSVVSVPLESPGLSDGLLHLAQLRGRPLSVAAARFADQLSDRFNEMYETV
ncbi:MAG: LysR family transcriptional regulator [Hyphomicrobiaceae bacterium]